MIAHVVLFKPAVSLSDEQRHAMLEGVAGAIRACPTVRRCTVGRRVLHGVAGYEQAMREDFQYFLLLEFDGVVDLQAYLTHPAHGMLGSLFSGGAAALAYDYEAYPLEDALSAFARSEATNEG